MRRPAAMHTTSSSQPLPPAAAGGGCVSSQCRCSVIVAVLEQCSRLKLLPPVIPLVPHPCGCPSLQTAASIGQIAAERFQACGPAGAVPGLTS